MDIGIMYLVVAFALLFLSLLKDRQKTKKALKVSYKMVWKMFPILFLVFILMGVIQALVSKEFLASIMGSGGGIFSILIAEVIGSVALIMPAAVFPFGGFLHESGAGYSAIIAFVMSSILIGISTIPLEVKVFGKRFSLVRNILTFLFIILMGIVFWWVL